MGWTKELYNSWRIKIRILKVKINSIYKYNLATISLKINLKRSMIILFWLKVKKDEFKNADRDWK